MHRARHRLRQIEGWPLLELLIVIQGWGAARLIGVPVEVYRPGILVPTQQSLRPKQTEGKAGVGWGGVSGPGLMPALFLNWLVAWGQLCHSLVLGCPICIALNSVPKKILSTWNL